MSKIIRKTFIYEENYPLAAIRYTFVAEILKPEAIGRFINHLVKAVQRHLVSENKFDYQLGLNISSGTISNFNAHLSKEHNYELIHARLLKYTQSSKSLLDEDNKITIEITALLLDDSY